MTRIVPPQEWGRDHWTTLLYVETRAVDHDGILDTQYMRPRHPQYPTILKGGVRQEEGHGDYDCLNDMLDAGLITVEGSWNNKISLTDLGWNIAGQARRHRAEVGGLWDEFSPAWPNKRRYAFTTPEQQQEILRLYTDDGLGYGGIANRTGIARATVSYIVRKNVPAEARRRIYDQSWRKGKGGIKEGE